MQLLSCALNYYKRLVNMHISNFLLDRLHFRFLRVLSVTSRRALLRRPLRTLLGTVLRALLGTLFHCFGRRLFLRCIPVIKFVPLLFFFFIFLER